MADQSGTAAAQESRRKRKRSLWWLGGGLAGVMGAGALVGQGWAADDLTPKAEDALRAAGHEGVEVEFTGREAVIGGTGTEADFEAAKTTVEDIRGVRRVDIERDDLGAGADAEGLSLSINVGPDGATLDGVVPDAAMSDGVAEALRDMSGGEVDGELAVDPDISAPEWLAGVPAAVAELGDVQDLGISVDGDTVTVAGSIADPARLGEIEAELAGHLPDVTIDNRIEVAEMGADEVAEQLADLTVLFERNSTEVSDEGAATLDQLVDVLESAPSMALEVVGHTSRIRSGNDAYARRISQERADAVVNYLVDTGVDPERLTTDAAGQDDPVGDNETNDGRALNRRVEFGAVEGND